MTLCTAWLRKGPSDEGQELVFATDSRLSGGESWDHGLKLFDLGRPDCLLCFAGLTERAYPLVLNGTSFARSNGRWTDPRLDLYDILDELLRLFTDLSLQIRVPPETGEDIHDLRAGAEFLFGGWSWRKQHYGVWRLHYSKDLEAFTHEAYHEDDDPDRLYTFIGNDVATANTKLEEALRAAGKLMRGALDMEPLVTLAQMARLDPAYPHIGGALQVAKVYRSGNSEFFGVMWPSAMNGVPHVLGRPVDPYDSQPVRLLDPDSGLLVDAIPFSLSHTTGYDFGDEAPFVARCYAGGTLDQTLSVAERDRLERIFRSVSFRAFVAAQAEAPTPEPAEDVELPDGPAEDASPDEDQPEALLPADEPPPAPNPPPTEE